MLPKPKPRAAVKDRHRARPPFVEREPPRSRQARGGIRSSQFAESEATTLATLQAPVLGRSVRRHHGRKNEDVGAAQTRI